MGSGQFSFLMKEEVFINEGIKDYCRMPL